MFDAQHLLQSTLDSGVELLRAPLARGFESSLIPIRSLGENHRARILQHLLQLSAADRYLRFGYAAQDAQIARYVDGLDFARDDIFGIYNRRLELIAVAHLAYASDPAFQDCAEFGVSVLEQARGRGFGARLFERAAMHAANDGVQMMFIHALSENRPMLEIARKAGARIERDGTESEAFLQLPARTVDSCMREMLQEQVAQADYRIKLQAKQFWQFLRELQALHKGTPAD